MYADNRQEESIQIIQNRKLGNYRKVYADKGEWEDTETIERRKTIRLHTTER